MLILKRKLFMLVWDMDVNKGGINSAMFKRSSMFSNSVYTSELLTLDYKANYPEITTKLQKMGKIPLSVRITNVHDYYKGKYGKNTVGKLQGKEYSIESRKSESDYHVEDGGDTARYFQDGVYIKFKRWSENGVLLHVDHFNENRVRTKRSEYHKEGYRTRQLYYHPLTNKITHELYYTKDGFCYLTKWFNFENGKDQKVCIFEPDNKKVLTFSNSRDFHIYWLNEMASLEKQKSIIICDGPGSALRVIKTNKDLLHKIYVVHSNHFATPHNYGSEIKVNHLNLLNNIKESEAIVLLTRRQEVDIIKQFGNYNNTFVIPHYIEDEMVAKTSKKNQVVMIARYHPEKGIDSAIRAFSEVIKEIPQAKLDIYGDGAQKNALKKLIDELNLQDHVQLKGYANKVNEVFSEASISLLTSKYEGFGLVILESMINKTPVISYDVNYGPADVIDHGENGYLVVDKDEEDLASKIIYLLRNQQVSREMGENGRKKVLSEYSSDIFYKKWDALFKKILMNKKD